MREFETFGKFYSRKMGTRKGKQRYSTYNNPSDAWCIASFWSPKLEIYGDAKLSSRPLESNWSRSFCKKIRGDQENILSGSSSKDNLNDSKLRIRV